MLIGLRLPLLTFARWDKHIKNTVFFIFWLNRNQRVYFQIPFVDLCSSKTQIMHTPGPSPDAITVVARNVPSMGTVAITG